MPDGSTTSSKAMDLAALTAPAAAVDTYLRAFLEARPLPTNLREATSYALFGPGKRMRPILVVRACEAVGGSVDEALPPAGAIELIHCFSLVHDDLPAMDDDDLRRGRPTLHKHTNEAMAILAGDLMTGLAFELLATKLDADVAATLTAELATATNDMIAGQVYDTLPDFPAGLSDMAKLQTIHRHKTGALIRCACRMGAIVGRGSSEQVEALTRYADAIGLMFQVVDDLLDVTQTTEHLGKAAGKDADAGKLTYPGLIGIVRSKAEVARLHQQATDALNQADLERDSLQMLCDYLGTRSR